MNPLNNEGNSNQENQFSNFSYEDNTGLGPQMLNGQIKYNNPNNLNLNKNNGQFNPNLTNNLNNIPWQNNYFQEIKNSQSKGQQIPINFQVQNQNLNLFNKENNNNNHDDHEIDHFTDFEKNNNPENNEIKNSNKINEENPINNLGGFSIFDKDNQKYYPFSKNLNQEQEELNKNNQNNNIISQQINNNLGNNININSIQENKNTYNMPNKYEEQQNVMTNKNNDPTSVNIIKNDYNNNDGIRDSQEQIDENAMSMPKEDLEKIQNPINIIGNNNNENQFSQPGIKNEINNQNQNVLSQNNIQNIDDNMSNFKNNNVNQQNNLVLNPFNNNNLIGNENMNFNNMNNEINNKGNEIKSNAVLNNMNYNQMNENLMNKSNNNVINNKNDNQGFNFVNKDLINQMQMQMSNENINNQIGNMNINDKNNFNNNLGLNDNQNNSMNKQNLNKPDINMDNINNQIGNMNINNNNNLGLNDNLQNLNENIINNPQHIEPPQNNVPPQFSFSIFKNVAKTGLKNLGDTSYLNAVLQLLGTVRDLAKYLVNPNNEKYFVDNINNAPLSFVIYRLFTHLFPLPEKHDREIYSPETLLKVLANYNQVYNSNEARNPNDLLLFILNKIHKEINLIKMIYIIKMNHLNKEDVINKSLASFFKSNKSIISNNFHWFELKTQTCSKCKKSFYYMNNYETLELDISNINANLNNNGPLTIEKCLQLQKQKMQKCFCESCKTYYPMNIITEVYSTPKYFIFSLNREGNQNQNLLHVPFFIEENINLQPFIVFKESLMKFKLQGIVSISIYQNNKYVCFGKSPVNDKWYLYNDDKVDIFDINNILNLHNQNFEYIPCILIYKYSA